MNKIHAKKHICIWLDEGRLHEVVALIWNVLAIVIIVPPRGTLARSFVEVCLWLYIFSKSTRTHTHMHARTHAQFSKSLCIVKRGQNIPQKYLNKLPNSNLVARMYAFTF